MGISFFDREVIGKRIKRREEVVCGGVGGVRVYIVFRSFSC